MAVDSRKFEVLLTRGAEQDLQSLRHYIAEFDSLDNANAVLDALLGVTWSLSKSPQRGSYPKELIGLGISEYRQILFKPYRLIYRIVGGQVIIHLITDERRDMQSVLGRRLLGA